MKKKLREEALEWLKSQGKFNRRFYCVAIQSIVSFQYKGLKHAISRNYKYPNVELQIIKIIPEIFTSAHYICFDKNEDLKTIREVRGTHNYYAIVSFELKIYEVWLKIKETKDGYFFYDYGIIRMLE